jgi:hypothetical protein
LERWRYDEAGSLFILVVNNIALQRPFGSTTFLPDMCASSDVARFTEVARYIKENLFGEMRGQAEKLLADSPHSSKIKFSSMYISGVPVSDATSFAGEQGGVFERFLKPRREAVVTMLAGIGMNPDIVFIVTKSPTCLGFVTDLYRDSDENCHGTIVFNRKVGRPIQRCHSSAVNPG